jgi:flagellar basal body P-ring formation protein FlgA
MRPERGVLLPVLLIVVLMVMLVTGTALAKEPQSVESRLLNLIKEVYSPGEDIYVKFLNVPAYLKEDSRIRNMSFVKVPEASGDGICSVDIEEKSGRDRTIQIAFKVLLKKKLFVLKEDMKRGDTLGSAMIAVRETYLNGSTIGFPRSAEEISGRRLKKDQTAGTIITTQMVEEAIQVQRGEIVTLVADNRRLMVQAKGRTMERGKIGDTIRVKNLTSGKEVSGKLTGGDTVTVTF